MADERTDESWRGKNGLLTEAELEAFLATDVLCRIGCLDEDGWPYVVPVWFQYKDGGYYLIARERSEWAAMVQRDGRVSLSIDETGSQRKVLVKGLATIVETPNVGGAWVAIGEEMAVRYLGPNGPKYLVPTLGYPRWLIFVRPIETKTWQGVDWAKKYLPGGDAQAPGK
jgi:hypothetical protein